MVKDKKLHSARVKRIEEAVSDLTSDAQQTLKKRNKRDYIFFGTFAAFFIALGDEAK